MGQARASVAHGMLVKPNEVLAPLRRAFLQIERIVEGRSGCEMLVGRFGIPF